MLEIISKLGQGRRESAHSRIICLIYFCHKLRVDTTSALDAFETRKKNSPINRIWQPKTAPGQVHRTVSKIHVVRFVLSTALTQWEVNKHCVRLCTPEKHGYYQRCEETYYCNSVMLLEFDKSEQEKYKV